MNSICGVDVSKARLDAAIAQSRASASFANTPEGVAALALWCREQGVDLVVMEATGGLEQPAFRGLWAEGVKSALVNARNVRDFAKSMGFFEKTDRIDAALIARFAAARGIVPGAPPNPAAIRLKALATRLRQLGADLTVQKQRRSSTTEPMARQSLEDVIGVLAAQQKQLAAELAKMIDADPLWAKLDASFRSIKGVADRTVAYLMAELPEIGILPNKAISKLCGFAPLADDSGDRSGQRHIRGGRAGLRSILFLVAYIAQKFDPSLRDFHQRLLDAGKPKMVARIALAHKLLVRLNAKARDARREFQMNT